MKWGEKQNLATPMPKFWEKVGERREKWCDRCGREKKEFRQWYCKKKKKRNWIAEIGRLKEEKKKTELWQE